MTDISFTGGYIDIKGGGGLNVHLTDFAADVSPVQFEKLSIAEGSVNCSGKAYFWRRPAPVIVIINVAPGTKDADNLTRMLRSGHIDGSGTVTKISALEIKSIDVFYPQQNKSGVSTTKHVKFSNGRMTDGDLAPSIEANGRMGALSFTFMMEKVEGN